MIMSRIALLAAASLLALSACTSLDKPLGGASFGVAAANGFAEQVVDPTPTPGAPILDAEMSNAAINRYRTDKVKTGEKEEAPVIELNLPLK